jgi:hypothetical protein
MVEMGLQMRPAPPCGAEAQAQARDTLRGCDTQAGLVKQGQCAACALWLSRCPWYSHKQRPGSPQGFWHTGQYFMQLCLKSRFWSGLAQPGCCLACEPSWTPEYVQPKSRQELGTDGAPMEVQGLKSQSALRQLVAASMHRYEKDPEHTLLSEGTACRLRCSSACLQCSAQLAISVLQSLVKRISLILQANGNQLINGLPQSED